jgi:hypothetical protein
MQMREIYDRNPFGAEGVLAVALVTDELRVRAAVWTNYVQCWLLVLWQVWTMTWVRLAFE